MAKFNVFFKNDDDQVKGLTIIDFETMPRIGEWIYVEIWTGRKILFEVHSIIHIFDQPNNVGNMFLVPLEQGDTRANWFLNGVLEDE